MILFIILSLNFTMFIAFIRWISKLPKMQTHKTNTYEPTIQNEQVLVGLGSLHFLCCFVVAVNLRLCKHCCIFLCPQPPSLIHFVPEGNHSGEAGVHCSCSWFYHFNFKMLFAFVCCTNYYISICLNRCFFQHVTMLMDIFKILCIQLLYLSLSNPKWMNIYFLNGKSVTRDANIGVVL